VRLCAAALQQLYAVLCHCIDVVAATAFWGTILLPLAIVWTLLTGLAAAEPPLLVALLGLNVVCILVGQRHHPAE